MIALNETLEYAAEVPFTLPLAADPLTGLTGWVFTLGEVQIRLPGAGSWINVATSKIVEKGYGRYCARLTSSQTTTAGTVAILANVAGATEQPYVGYETIGELGGDIPVSGSGYLLFYLPDATDPIYNPPITTANFAVSGTLRICLPNDVYRDCTLAEKNAVVNLGNGLYGFPLSGSLTATRGKTFLYAEYPSAQRFEGFTTILGVGSAPTVTPPSPTPLVAVSTTSPEYTSHALAAVSRLCEQFRSGDVVTEITGLDSPLEGEL